MLLEVSTQRGEIEQGEREMLYKVFDFADKEASDVMVPRPEVVGISVEMAPEEALRAVLESPYTRYPVFRESLDEIVGILHVRDLVSALHDSSIAEVELAALLRPAYVVPETKDLAALLAEFRRTNQHMSVVVDEYGATQGIVTLEDLLEEIVGEIEDEFDLPDESIERINETTIRIDGTFPIDDFNEELGTAIEHEDFHTVAGYVFDLIGRAAEPGDEVRTDGLRFTVLDVEGSRIQRIEVEFLPDGRAGRRQGRRGGVDQDHSTPPRGDSPLRHRDFVLFLGITAATAFAVEMSFVAIGWQVYSVRSNPLDLGLVGLAMFIPLPLLALPAGHWADRYPRRTLLGLATLLDASVMIGLLFVTRSGADATWPFFVLAFGTGVATARRLTGLAGDDAVARPARDPRSRTRSAVGHPHGVRDRGPGARRPAVRAGFGARLRGRGVALARRVRRHAAASRRSRRRRWHVSRPRERARRRQADPPHAGAARARSRSTCSPSCSAAPLRSCPCSRRTSSMSGLPAWGCSEPRRRSGRCSRRSCSHAARSAIGRDGRCSRSSASTASRSSPSACRRRCGSRSSRSRWEAAPTW